MTSERIRTLEARSAELGRSSPQDHFERDYHYAGTALYAGLPHWEKMARSMAYAVVNQDVLVYEDEGIGGRGYHLNGAPVEQPVPEFDYKNGGISLCRDGFHLSLDYGRYIAAAVWLRVLSGKPVSAACFEGFEAEKTEKIVDAVNAFFMK